MMSDRLASLNLILARAGVERDHALAVLRQTEIALAHAQQQATELQAYRCQYGQRWSERFRAGESVVLVQIHQDFGHRLDQAITLQHDAMAQAQARVQAARRQVVAHEQRVASVRKLIERRMVELERHETRRDQRLTDEAALRAHRDPGLTAAEARFEDPAGRDVPQLLT